MIAITVLIVRQIILCTCFSGRAMCGPLQNYYSRLVEDHLQMQSPLLFGGLF